MIMSNVSVEQIIDVIVKANIVKDKNILAYDKALSEQGVDSLDFSGLLFSLEETFKVEIPDEDIDGLQTINDIVVYVNSKCE